MEAWRGVILNIGTAWRSEINLHYLEVHDPSNDSCGQQANAGTVVQNRSVSVLLLRTLTSNAEAVVEVSFLYRAIQRSATTLNCMVTGVTKVQDTRI